MRLALALLLLLILPGSAAAATWSPPQHVSGSHTFVDDLSLVVAGGGRTLATWRFQDGIGNASHGGYQAASRAPGGSAFGIVRRVPASLPSVAAYRQGRVLLATPDASATHVYVRLGHADGT